jgi:hypothetical protein
MAGRPRTGGHRHEAVELEVEVEGSSIAKRMRTLKRPTSPVHPTWADLSTLRLLEPCVG